MEVIKLDLIPSGKMPSLHASQYDDGRDYHIDLTENRAPYTLDGTETISLTVRKCDNTLVIMDIANTFADKSYIEFRTTEQMNACAGFNYGEITIEKNGTQISSLNFYLQVEGAPDEGGITSQSEINNLARQVHDIVVEELADNGASETGYDNTESGLEATNVQDAIDEVNTKIENIPSVDAYTKEQSDEKYATKTELSNKADVSAIPTKTSQLQNDSGFATMQAVEQALPALAEPVVEALVPTVIGNDYYNKTQTDEKLGEITNNEKALNSEVLIVKPALDFNGYIIATTGNVSSSSYGKCTDFVEIGFFDRLEWNSAGGNDSVARVAFYNADKTYISSLTINSGTEGMIDLSDSAYALAKYVRLSYYDYPNKDFSKYKGKIYRSDSIARREDVLSRLDGTDRGVNVLIFGDSITDCASFTIVDDKTTVYNFIGTNSYTDAGGHHIVYKMWSKLFEEYIPCAEIRNYARSNASYKDQNTPDDPRRSLSYQLTLAINDLDNPNGAFKVDNFNPDVIFFALGVNDGLPNDTPANAYAKIVTTSSGIDLDATLSALDRSKFCEAVLWAYFTARKHFPYALIFNVLPLQRMANDEPIGNLRTYLEEISKRYGGAVCIDGAYESGIVKENNVVLGLGTTLKDGLHPNDKGQNMLARLIIGKYKSYYVPFDYMNP